MYVVVQNSAEMFSAGVRKQELICRVQSMGKLLKWEGNRHKAETLTRFGLIWCLRNTLHFHMLHNVGWTNSIPREEPKYTSLTLTSCGHCLNYFLSMLFSPTVTDFMFQQLFQV